MGNFEKAEWDKKHKVVVKDKDMKNYLECALGGGKVHNERQFLKNDRKVLSFQCNYEDLLYTANYYLADDTIEVKEKHVPNSGRDAFPMLLGRQKLPYNYEILQPGQNIGNNYLTEQEI